MKFLIHFSKILGKQNLELSEIQYQFLNNIINWTVQSYIELY